MKKLNFYRSCKARNQCYDCVRLGNDAVGGSQMTCDPNSVLYSFKLAKENDRNVIHCCKLLQTKTQIKVYLKIENLKDSLREHCRQKALC